MLTVQISAGEFLDKLTILEIKMARISDPQKLANVQYELNLLRAVWAENDLGHKHNHVTEKLKNTNESLWDLETRIRAKQASGTFDQEFIEVARSISALNDRRAALKLEINKMLNSQLVEEKCYEDY